MRRLRAWLMRLAAPLTASRREREMAEEFAAHLQLHIDDNVRAGMSPADARRVAMARFGGVEAVKEAYRDRAALPFAVHVVQDLRFALRWMRHMPLFSLTIVITVMLAVGVNAAIFTALNAAALQPLSAPDGRALVAVSLHLEGQEPRGVHGSRSMLSWPEFEAVRESVGAFSGAAAHSPLNPVTLGGQEPRQVLATVASCEYFAVLRVQPALGRAFLPSDCSPGAPAVVVLSDRLWRSAFDADPAIVGRAVPINRSPFIVVGVGPAGFAGTQLVAEDAFVPVAAHAIVNRGRDFLHDANMSWLFVIGRLRDGASLASARADLSVVAARLTAAGQGRRTFRLAARRAARAGTPEIRDLVLGVGGLIVGGVTLVLLIACANVANLLLARAASRRREFAVRLALGASRARLVQQLLTESLLLAFAGGAMGVLAAAWTTRAVVRVLLTHLPAGSWPIVFDPTPDWRVLAYAVCVIAATGVAFGLGPALHATREAGVEFRSAMTTERPRGRRLQHALVGVQFAVSILLLLCAGLLARGLYRSHTIDPGLSMERVSVVAYDLAAAGYSPAAAAAFQGRVLERLGAMPGVQGVALTSAVPLSDQHQETRFAIDGSERQRYLEFSEVSPSFFDLLGIRLVAGRTFSDADLDSGRAAIVTESTARRLWPGADPLAHTLVLDGVPRPIVGIVRDAQVSRLGQPDSVYVFLPADTRPQSTSQSSSGITSRTASVLVAGGPGDPSPRALADAVRELDPGLAVDVARLSANLEQWQVPSLLISSLAATLGLLALVLACTGVFGTVAYTVSRRTREIGIRVALGAAHQDVQRLIVRQGMRPVLFGMAAGVAAAAVASTVLTNMLFGVSAHDPWAFVLVPALLAAVALLACYLPARRALGVEPTIALRVE